MRQSLSARARNLRRADVPVILAGLLLATMLFQRPLVQLEWRGTFLIRSWDVLWLVFAIGSAIVMFRDRVDLRAAWRGLPAFLFKTPLGLFTLFALAAIPSLAVTAVTFGSSHFGDAAIRAGRFAGAAFVGIVLVRYLTARTRHALTVFALGISAVAGLWAFLAWVTLRRDIPLAGGGVHEITIGRGAGPFGNYFNGFPGQLDQRDHWWVGAAGANDLGFWLAMALGPVCVLALTEWLGQRRPRVLALTSAAVIALALGLAATHSREGWLAALVGLGVLAWFQRARVGNRWLRRLVLAAPALVIAVFLVVPSLRTRLTESFQPGTFGFQTGPRARLDSWHQGLQWGWDRFPIGWGVGGIEEHPELFGGATAENVFIQAWASMGIVGAGLLIGCFALAIRTGVAALRRNPGDLAANFALSFFVVFVAQGMLGNTLTDPTVEDPPRLRAGREPPTPARGSAAETGVSVAASRAAFVASLREQPWLYYAGYGLGRAAPIAVLPVVSHAVGVAGFGRFEVALALVTTAAILFDAGMGASIVRFARDTRFTRAEVIGTASSMQLVAAVVAVAVFAPVAVALSPRGLSAAEVVGVMALFAFVEGYAVIASGILRSDGRDRLFFSLSIARLAVTAGLGGALAYAIGPVGALIGVASGGAGFALLALWEWWRARTFGTPALRRIVLRYGLPLMATTLGGWTLAVSDRLFLQYYVSPSELGDYSANYRLGTVVLVFVAAPLTLAWIPKAQRTARDQLTGKRREWTRVYCIVAGLAAVVSTALSPLVVPLLFGDSFHAQPLIVGLVAAAGVMGGLYYLLATPVLVADSTTPLLKLALASVALNLVLNIALIPPAGAVGAAVSTAISYAGLCAGAVLVSGKAVG